MKKRLLDFLKPVKDYCYKQTNHLVKSAMEYIGDKYKKNIMLIDLAKHLGVTPQYMSRVLNAYSDLTFSELVSKDRIEESKILLRGNMKVNEVAFSLGFQSQNYFTKVFKKFTGMTPREYKNLGEINTEDNTN